MQPQTIIRTTVLVIALINQILVNTGHPAIPIENADLEIFITTGFTIVAATIAWWKNNSFTKAAIEGDNHMRKIKGECE